MTIRFLALLVFASQSSSAAVLNEAMVSEELSKAPLVVDLTIESVRTLPDTSGYVNRFFADSRIDRIHHITDSLMNKLQSGDRITVTGLGGERGEIGLFLSGFPRPHANERFSAYLNPDPEGTYAVIGLERGFLRLEKTRTFSRNRTDGSNGEGNGPFLFWDDGALPIPYAVSLPTFSDRPDFVEAIQKSFQTWQNVEYTKVDFLAIGCTTSMRNENDGVNAIVLITERWPFDPAAIAITRNFYIAGNSSKAGLILDSDILVNGVNHKFTTTDEPGKHDLQNIVTHEIGHFMGLGHETAPPFPNGESDAVMYAVAAPNEKNKRTLKANDLAAIRAGYAGVSTKVGSQGIQCDVVSPRPSCLATHSGRVPMASIAWALVYLAGLILLGRAMTASSSLRG